MVKYYSIPPVPKTFNHGMRSLLVMHRGYCTFVGHHEGAWLLQFLYGVFPLFDNLQSGSKTLYELCILYSVKEDNFQALYKVLTILVLNWINQGVTKFKKKHITDSMKIAFGIENCALKSFCLVITQANHCSEFLMPNC